MDMKTGGKMKDLTIKIKNYLESSFKRDPNKRISQEELLNKFIELKQSKTTSHDKCVQLWTIINDLNKEDEHIYMIKNNQYKIATKEESVEYIKNYFATKIVPSLKRYWNLSKKISEDEQYDIFTEKFKEVFIKGEKNERN